MSAYTCVCVWTYEKERERERESVLGILTENQLEISKVIAAELLKRSMQEAHLLKIITRNGS